MTHQSRDSLPKKVSLSTLVTDLLKLGGSGVATIFGESFCIAGATCGSVGFLNLIFNSSHIDRAEIPLYSFIVLSVYGGFYTAGALLTHTFKPKIDRSYTVLKEHLHERRVYKEYLTTHPLYDLFEQHLREHS